MKDGDECGANTMAGWTMGHFFVSGIFSDWDKTNFLRFIFHIGTKLKKHGTDSVLHSKDTDDSDDTEVTEDNAAQSERSWVTLVTSMIYLYWHASFARSSFTFVYPLCVKTQPLE